MNCIDQDNQTHCWHVLAQLVQDRSPYSVVETRYICCHCNARKQVPPASHNDHGAYAPERAVIVKGNYK